MGLYDLGKDIISVAQKADNIEIMKQLMELSQTAMELQAKVQSLTLENQDLKNQLSVEKNIIRHPDGPYITLEDDENSIQYCSTCWGTNRKLIQFAHEKCPVCHTWRIKKEMKIYV